MATDEERRYRRAVRAMAQARDQSDAYVDSRRVNGKLPHEAVPAVLAYITSVQKALRAKLKAIG
jgi:hypothetical protein